ncbi:MAG: phosphotransferase family protein [Alphaproteobacteria bacterium]|nr:phosphotransferase family protein [Alphaproteobacteria bacterium]
MSDAARKPVEQQLNEAALTAYLRDAMPDVRGQLRTEQIGGGQSNPTYYLWIGERDFVLRKQPPGPLLPSAHAVDREYRVQKALADSDVPVARPLLFCEDRTIVGTPFYVMERRRGRVFHDCALPRCTPDQRAAMYADMARVLACIHKVDLTTSGLADFGRPGGYFARQIKRWGGQWQDQHPFDIPELDRLVDWLPQHVPAEDETTLIHGDYRVGNIMFHPTEPRIVAVFDWELSTLGHPLSDVAYNCLLYHSGPNEYGGILGLDRQSLGIPAEDDYVGAYCRHAGRRDRLAPFHLAFAMFRFAVIFAGIASRAKAGTAASADAERVGRLAYYYAGKGWEQAQRAGAR